MKIVAAIIALLCGIAVLAGIFLPWFGGSHFMFSVSGWDIAQGKDFAGMGMKEVVHEAYISSSIHALIVFLSAALVAVCALPAFILSLKAKGNNMGIVILGIIISLAAVAAIGGLIGFMIDINGNDFESSSWVNMIGYGVYVCAGGAILGLISGVLMAVRKNYF